MACVAEALGMALPGSAAIPAVHADRLRAAEATGEAAVGLVRSRLTPSLILTPAAIENALRVILAIGGSTNALVLCRSAGSGLTKSWWMDNMGSATPLRKAARLSPFT